MAQASRLALLGRLPTTDGNYELQRTGGDITWVPATGGPGSGIQIVSALPTTAGNLGDVVSLTMEDTGNPPAVYRRQRTDAVDTSATPPITLADVWVRVGPQSFNDLTDVSVGTAGAVAFIRNAQGDLETAGFTQRVIAQNQFVTILDTSALVTNPDVVAGLSDNDTVHLTRVTDATGTMPTGDPVIVTTVEEITGNLVRFADDDIFPLATVAFYQIQRLQPALPNPGVDGDGLSLQWNQTRQAWVTQAEAGEAWRPNIQYPGGDIVTSTDGLAYVSITTGTTLTSIGALPQATPSEWRPLLNSIDDFADVNVGSGGATVDRFFTSAQTGLDVTAAVIRAANPRGANQSVFVTDEAFGGSNPAAVPDEIRLTATMFIDPDDPGGTREEAIPAYAPDTPYTPNTVVSHDGNIYRRTVGTGTNYQNPTIPTEVPGTDNTVWELQGSVITRGSITDITAGEYTFGILPDGGTGLGAGRNVRYTIVEREFAPRVTDPDATQDGFALTWDNATSRWVPPSG